MKLPFSSLQSSVSTLQKYSGVLGSLTGAPIFKKSYATLPVQPLSLLHQAKSYLGMRNETLKLGLFVDPRLADATIDCLVQLFKPAGEKTRVLVHVIKDEMSLSDHVSYDAAVFVVHGPDCAQQLIAAAHEQGLPTLVVLEEGLRHDAATAYDISILDVASARKDELLTTQMANWFADNLSEHRMALAADFAFMRPALASSTITATARQNAIIAAVFFVPGADLPVMTMNQIKMVLQLAFIYGEDLTLSRVAESAVVVIAAYSSRAAVRTVLAGTSRIFNLPLKCAVAYASTLALGKGMELWLQKAPDIPLLEKPIPSLTATLGTQLETAIPALKKAPFRAALPQNAQTKDENHE
ncbi:MAG: hypothetical protein FWF11_00095 [Coriobacteriia bacterium]|nr:hypothetical protein [Coriobacteriia bacterium]